LELRDKRVAEDQVVPGPANKQEIAERMVTWVTPYQRHFLDFPLTLHDRDLPPDIDDARANLTAFVDEVMSHTPPLLSHIKHSQWEYHWADFQAARRLSNRIRSWGKARLEGLATAVISFARVIQTAATCIARVIRIAMTCVARVIQTAVTSFARMIRTAVTSFARMIRTAVTSFARMIRTAVTSFARMTQRTLWNTLRLPLRVKARTIELRAKRKMIEKCKPFARVVGERYVRPALRRLGLEIIRSTNLLAIQEKVNEANLRASEATLKAREVADLKRQQQAEREEMTRLKRQQQAEREEMTRLKRQQQAEREEMTRLKQQQQAEREEMTRLKHEQQAASLKVKEVTGLKQQQQAEREEMTRLKRQQQAEREEMTRLKQQQQVEREKISDLSNIAAEYQFKLERTYDYQTLMMEDQIRAGMRDLEPEFLALYKQCREYTMTSWERLYALYKSVQYTVENGIPGAFVECGVWRGGSMKLVAHVLHFLGDTKRTLFLYDTFEGMTEPDPAVDVDFSGNAAANDWRQVQRRGVKWAYAPVEEVHKIIATSGYPMNMVKFVKGRVEETIPGTIPVSIALLRLDTDWYSSTKHEMEHLYPKLSSQGILILDDYGHYQGARRAVDEYLSKLDKKPLLQRVDYSCRLAVKPTA
jgi:O-methyltransferase